MMDYFLTESWHKKRTSRLEIDKHQCRLCGATENLQVHHKPDSYAKIPNESIEDDLTTLCEACHDLITNRIRQMRYDSRPVDVEIYESNVRKVNENGRDVEKIEVQAHRGCPAYTPQRTT
jgi:5-methylcytosine-specific restriction endonuclease McrA